LVYTIFAVFAVNSVFFRIFKELGLVFWEIHEFPLRIQKILKQVQN